VSAQVEMFGEVLRDTAAKPTVDQRLGVDKPPPSCYLDKVSSVSASVEGEVFRGKH